jgi:hypothetical protein
MNEGHDDYTLHLIDSISLAEAIVPTKCSAVVRKVRST